MKINDIVKKIFVWPMLMAVCFFGLCMYGLLCILLNKINNHLVEYCLYGLSFYSLVVFCVACIRRLPVYYRFIKSKLNQNKYTHKYLHDEVYKTRINLMESTLIDTIYVCINLYSYFAYKSNWFGLYAVYYASLVLVRVIICIYINFVGLRMNILKELKVARICTYILSFIHVVLMGIVLMMAYVNRGFNYGEYMIYLMAFYTFYTIIVAIINFIKYRKHSSPLISVSKLINIVTSLISLLALETAMLERFGTNTTIECDMLSPLIEVGAS